VKRTIEVSLRPGLVPAFGVALVVDVLRATTTLVTMVERGCGPIHLAPSTAAARAAAVPDRPLLIGEEGGLAPAGFDYGNSPVALSTAPLAGRAAVFATTNGAPAVHAAAAAAVVLLACLRNAAAAARAAWEALPGEGAIVIICAGRAENPGGFGVDDLYTAGVLVQRLAALGDVTLADGAEAARLIAAGEPEPLRVLRRCAAGQHLLRLGLGEDLIFAAAVDRSVAVPRLGRDLFLVTG
jgi:2-phosphosulfolactate phosphatase